MSKKKTPKRSAKKAAAPAAKKAAHKRSAKKRPAAKRAARRGPSPLKGRKHKNWGKVKAHKRKVNPSHFTKKRSHRRGRSKRRNPSLGPLARVALAGGTTLFSILLITVAGYYASNPGNEQRNRTIFGAVLAAIGGFLGFKGHVALGAGLFAGGLVSAASRPLTDAAFKVLPAKSQQTTQAVYANDMRGYNQLGAVQYDDMRGYDQLGAVMADNMAGYAPPPPWDVQIPYGSG